MTVERALLTLLQFAGGLFPTGGFAHSFGLETYVQDGRVHDRQGLEAFIAAHLEGSAGPTDAAAVSVAVRLATRGEADGWIALDQRLDAMKPVPEFRAASRQMGRQTLRIAAGLGADSFLGRLAGAVDIDLACGHHASVFGAVVGRGGVAPAAAGAAYLYSTAEVLVGAGLRLIPIGQLEGQRVLAAMRARIERLAAAAAAATTADDLWSFNPAIEIAGLRHATLDTRLFRS